MKRTALQRQIAGPKAAEPIVMVKSNAMTLDELVERYATKRLRGKALGTEFQYIKAVGHFRDFLNREPTVDDLTDDRVTDLQFALQESRGLAAATVASYIKKLLSLWRFAARHRIVEPWPEVEVIAVPTRDPIAWTEAEIKAIFAALREQEGDVGPVPARHWWPALWLMFYDTAERLAAVLSLRMEDLSLPTAWVTFRAEFRKGKLRDRGMPLHAETVEALRLITDGYPKRQYIFEAPFSLATLLQKYKRILRDAGLPYDRKRLFHCIRRTVASHFESNGHDATELLDHSMRKVTTDSYLSPQIVRRARPASVLFRPDTATDREKAEAAAKSREEAKARRLAELKKKCGDSLAAWAKAYAEDHPDQRENTDQNRRLAVRHFAEFLGRAATLADVTPRQTMQFALWRMENGAAELTADRERGCLLPIRRFAEGADDPDRHGRKPDDATWRTGEGGNGSVS